MGVLFQGVAPPVTNRPLPLVPVVTNDGMHLKQGIVASESEIPVINVEPPLEWHALSLTVADQQVGKRGRNIGLDIQSNSPRRSYVATISASFALPASNEQAFDKEVVAVANTSPLVSGFAKNVTSSELYGPWMIVDNRKP
ncbi:hypothetical protein V6N13_108324 [Hibiscus sabdariffa]